MKQMPANPNQPFAFQPMQARPQWPAYQQTAQQAQTIASTSNSTKTSGGLMSLLKKLNPARGNLTETLDQIQNFLKMAQSVTPKIQEYGPIIKSLPAMLAMMNELDDEEAETDTEQSETDDDSTDELDKLLGLDQADEKQEKKEKQVVKSEPVKRTNQGDNLYKIETLDDQTKPKYQEPMLFI